MFVLLLESGYGDDSIPAPNVDITELVPMSSIVEHPPTSMGDCLASVGDVGINVSSSSSNFVWVHFELVPGNDAVVDAMFTVLPSDVKEACCPSDP